MTPQVGNRQLKVFQQSQLSLLSKQSMNQQAQFNIIDYSTQCKSSQPIISDDNCKTTNSRKSISNIAQSLASKRQKHQNIVQDTSQITDSFTNYYDARFNSDHKSNNINTENFISQQSRAQNQTHVNFYIPDSQGILMTNSSRPVLQNPLSAKQFMENVKQQEHFDNLIDHLRRVKTGQQSNQKSELTSYKGSMNTTLNKNSSMIIINENQELNGTGSQKSTITNDSQRESSMKKQDQNDLKMNNSFIRKNFYMVRQQPSQRIPKPESNNINAYMSPFSESPVKGSSGSNNTILMRKQMYQTNNVESGVASQRNNLSERLSTAYQKLSKFEPNKSIAESSFAGPRKNQKVKRQELEAKEDQKQQNPLIRYQNIVSELQRLEQKEENQEKCLVPSFPIIDTSQSHNQPFLDLIREIKKEFTNESCLKDEHQIFAGAYNSDKAKGLGRKVDADYIYKGNFSEGVKKGPGIQLFLSQSKKYDVYRGEWNDDKPNGRGIYFYYKSGVIIEGNFKDGAPDTNGNFKIRYSNGDVYEGNIQNRHKNGKGKLHYINGDLYEGEWHNDK
ncbi:UNKNOWN [Stylonychia lemnae]|uniref:Morn repeat protein n=1 Tax=Stylonychia lemnae TaxID=5949 RepID=A0A077ZVP6_STYLE|nr:UNKNOWN [Stylonychia lemnae]|eukprot:CDW74010.1 UNKNOWN [Stylonychia lemnae]